MIPELTHEQLEEIIFNTICRYNTNNAQTFRVIYATSRYRSMYPTPLACMNAFWRYQLTRLPFGTSDQRECLTDEQIFGPWLNNFMNYIMPLIINHNLPQAET